MDVWCSNFSYSFLLQELYSLSLILRVTVFGQTSIKVFEVLTFESTQRAEGNFWRKTLNRHLNSECGFQEVWSSN
jgi:hypothetical protein